MKLLVTGATGFIGSRFCELAATAGHEIVALVRAGKDYSGPAECVYGALPYDVPRRAWKGVEACVHCAAVTTSAQAAQSEAVNFEGTRFLLNAALEFNVSRFVFLSSQSAHENAVSAYGITKRKGEELIQHSGLPYAILRPGLVYGPGELGLFWRMRKSIRKLPLLPLLGGGKALVQPIHVDDLCEAMLRCLQLPRAQNEELYLGDPDGLPLREFLQQIEIAERGKRKFAIPIPLGPVKFFVSAGEKCKLPLPVSSDNLKGMEVVQRMDTSESLKRLQLSLRPLAVGLAQSIHPPVEQPVPETPGRRAPVRLLLVGAGKIGIVHALNARMREDEQLVGIVDKNPKAFSLYRSMGFNTRFYTELEVAVEEQQPEAVIIATPASTHLPLAQWCMERNLPVLVEKPLAVKAESILEYRCLAAQYPSIPFCAGYMAAQFPHLERAIQVMQSGVLGKVVGFSALALQSHIMAAKPIRWEMVAAKSGGGALINYAGHVVSMIFRLFGVPAQMDGARWTIYSTEVEDAIVARMRYSDFSGELLSSWSAPGYPRPQNLVEVKCERGTIVIENFATSIRSAGRTEQIWSQRDFEVGYNASPDYTGAGFSAEHQNLVDAVRRHQTHVIVQDEKGVMLDEAATLEAWMFAFYRQVPLERPTSERLSALLSNRDVLQKARQLCGQDTI